MYKVGWSEKSIVPDRPAMLQGQKHTRVAQSTLDPLTVTAMAIEGSRAGERSVLVSFDLAIVSEDLRDEIRARVAKAGAKVDTQRLLFAVTHTHTSLVYEGEFYPHPGGDVMRASECFDFLAARGAEVVIEALGNMAPAKIGRGFGHAVVGHNRRAVYADGHAEMYGRTNRPDFRQIEGYEDHSVDFLFIYDAEGKLTGTLIDIPCPSQVDEHLTQYSADYWHEVRVALRKRLKIGDKLKVLPMCAPAGDQSPHFLLYKAQEAEMRKRRGVTERQEIAERVAHAFDRACGYTQPMEGEAILEHRVDRVSLTPRQVNKKERDWAEAEYKRSVPGMDPSSWWPALLKRVVDQFEGRFVPPRYEAEVHVLRIGEVALATNPFELYVDFGMQIKALSNAPQTILAQITSGMGWYLPTQRAVDGGSYGALPVVCKCGPEGGQELVDHTVKTINALFPAPAK